MAFRAFQNLFALILFISILFTISVLSSEYIADNNVARELIGSYGYIGILVLAIIGGFNLVVPIPAAVFTPIFLASGLPTVGIILTLAIGTTIADIIGYLIGLWGRNSWDIDGSPFFQKIQKLRDKYRTLLIPIIFLYASFVPYPNELIVVPLAFLGMRIRTLILPLFLGSLLHNTILVFGIAGIVELFKL
jgi:membrane protein YqaA with SNARE-associated domain